MDALARFTVGAGFWKRYETLVIDEVIPFQEKALRDEIAGAEPSHAIENFEMAAQMIAQGHCDGAFYGMVFQDSDVAKWLEAVAYALRIRPDAALEKRADDVIALIGRAQHADGYLNTYFTVKEPDRRWTNLEEAHELYCAGHMIEAAVAFAEATGKTELLDIMRRMADHMVDHFITHNTEGFPGHPEVELALMRLAAQTGDARYAELASRFIDARGTDFFIRERKLWPWTVWDHHVDHREYAQTHLPVREQKDAVGHAVRAVYLYSGMADVERQTGDTLLADACRTLWHSITQHRMYITGAIGSAYEGEAFTEDDHLPNDAAYAETCAAVGLIFFARRMLEGEKRGEYADVMERALYNCVLAGMQQDGKRFFYVNPLEVVPGISGEAVSLKHSLPQRPPWFACACCPPNVARLLTSLGRYAWDETEDTVYSHLFVAGRFLLDAAGSNAVILDTDYPIGGTLTYRFDLPDGQMSRKLAVRQPEWSGAVTVLRNGEPANYSLQLGYMVLSGPFVNGDTVVVKLDMTARRVFAAARVASDSARVAFMRGPLVYCAEGADNRDDVLGLRAERESALEELPSDLFGGMAMLRLRGRRVHSDGQLYSSQRPEEEPCEITLIPYYAWGNRGLNEMRVWLPEV